VCCDKLGCDCAAAAACVLAAMVSTMDCGRKMQQVLSYDQIPTYGRQTLISSYLHLSVVTKSLRVDGGHVEQTAAGECLMVATWKGVVKE
jgi:hypothetical protein